jgi:hypothetical protein
MATREPQIPAGNVLGVVDVLDGREAMNSGCASWRSNVSSLSRTAAVGSG